MTPEALDAGHVRLYRADRFPDRWRHIADLVPGRHADPSPFEAGGDWWMFSCTKPGWNSTLRLHHAEAPTGRWTEHPCSPVVVDNRRSARPAGRIITSAYGLIRFAQDCYPDYGVGVRAFRIISLDRKTYREEPAVPDPIVGPGQAAWNRSGMHHVDARPWPEGGWIAAVDGR
jgi:hypothetical protein